VSLSSSDESFIERLLALPPEERLVALGVACANDPSLESRLPELRAAIEAASANQTWPADLPSSEVMVEALKAALDAASAEVLGTKIGPYKLLQEIGRGGFGVVWMAEQEEPIRRRVALKIIKAGMDTKEVIARFEAERQALALMDHPNIAHVFDAGATEAGRPYFVMELVRGTAITTYCDENRLSLEARLRLFVLVCQAVQHAHQKGVIHRDLKPSNILVTLHDGVPVPKVIDFGIAKATISPLTEKTLFTRFNAFIGTPAYTSPEQMEMSGLDVDTRSDVYSLGVLLYELLAGRPPFDTGTLMKAGLEAMRRMIREVDPPRPSHRLQTLSKDERTTVAIRRRTEPSKLSVQIHGDLDWIVMRCLEKDRTRRYETANGLASDIARHLGSQPVSARPPNRTYLFAKFVRRNRLLFATGSAVAAALILGLTASTWEAIRARRSERAAAVERGKAEDLLAFMVGELYNRVKKVGRLDILEPVVDKEMAYFAALAPRDRSDAAIARNATALTQIGEIRKTQARYSEAIAAFTDAYNSAAALSARHPKDWELLFNRGQAEYWIGSVHQARGESELEEKWFQQYLDTAKALVALDPARSESIGELAWGYHNVATARTERRDAAGALANFKAELVQLNIMIAGDIGDVDLLYRIADAHSWMAEVDDWQGDFKEALSEYHYQESLMRRIIETEPKRPYWRERLAESALLLQVDLNASIGQIELAKKELEEAQNIIEGLLAFDSTNRDLLAASLNCRLKQAKFNRQAGRGVEAMQELNDVEPQLVGLVANTADVSSAAGDLMAGADRKFARWLAMLWRLEAQLRARSDPAAAFATASKAVKLSQRLVSEGRAEDSDLGECATDYLVHGDIAAELHRDVDAQADWKSAADLLAPKISESRDWRLLDPAARAAIRRGKAEDARMIINLLNQLGYVPLDSWPTSDRAP
jgi:eukaryotic-like serine/threonine-protein kinase